MLREWLRNMFLARRQVLLSTCAYKGNVFIREEMSVCQWVDGRSGDRDSVLCLMMSAFDVNYHLSVRNLSLCLRRAFQLLIRRQYSVSGEISAPSTM